MDPDAKAHYEERAAEGAINKEEENTSDISHLKGALLLHAERERAWNQAKGLSQLLTDGRFTTADWDELVCIYTSYSKVTRARLSTAPGVPPLDVRQALEEHISPAPAQRSDPWVARACANRDDIVGVAFCNGEEVHSTTYLFLYGVLRPVELHVMELRRLPQVLPEYGRLIAADRRSAWESHHLHVFEVAGTYATHINWTFQPGDEIFVITDLFFDGVGRVVGDTPSEFLAVWLASLPARSSTTARPPAARMTTVETAVLEVHPWLKEYIHRAPAAEDDTEFPTPASKPVCDSPEDAYDVVAVAWAALEHRLATDAPSSTTTMEEGFFVRFRSGSSTGAGSSTDGGSSIGAEAAKGPARTWAIRYGLPQSTAFAVARYGSDIATRLAEEWCRRLAYFYGLWRRCGCDPYHIFSDGEKELCDALPEWHQFVASLDAGDFAHERAMAINLLVPSLPHD